jgi:diguanylate cyclase (GGDEF)-like protein/PAS domain S-box-containing protein
MEKRMAHHERQRFRCVASSRRAAGVLVFELDHGVTAADQAWADATGLSAQQSLGNGWLDALAPHSRAPALAQLEMAATGGAPAATEWEVEAGGFARLIDAVAQPVGDPSGRPRRCIVAIVDVTGQRRSEDELIHDATHDGLSGLLNRGAMERTVEHALTRLERAGSTVAVLYVDLDAFKSVNDRFGHRIGDIVLAAASRRLVLALRPSDAVARVGGDEFVIVCEDVDRAEDAVSVGRRVVEALARPFDLGGDRVELGASIGIAFTSDHETSMSRLVHAADRAMYDAKCLGRGRVVVGELIPQP